MPDYMNEFNDDFEYKNEPDDTTPDDAENAGIALKNTRLLKRFINDVITGNVDLVLKSVKSINMIKPTAESADENGLYTFSRNFSTAASVKIPFNNVALERGKKYTIKIFFDGGSITGGTYKVVYLNSPNLQNIGILKNSGTLKLTFTCDNEKYKSFNGITLDISQETNISDLKMRFMLYEGEDDKEYSPHQF